MRYQHGHKAETHRRIVRGAARQFRRNGLSGPAIATVMKASGLTAGGFYKHFRNRDDLLIEAVEEGFREVGSGLITAARQAPSGEGWKAIVKRYLSIEHCEHPDTGCPVAAPAPDIARANSNLKKRLVGTMQTYRRQLVPFMPGENSMEKERNFLVIFAAMAGAVAVARTAPDPATKQAVLGSVRDHLLESF